MRIKFHLIFITVFLFQSALARADCVAITNPEHTDSSSKFEINNAGNYCLKENLHSRFDFADHSPEPRLIHIWTSDVTIDLQGHVLGRGIIFRDPGGVGIQIEAGAKNITIKNGTMRDFDVAVYRSVATLGEGKKKTIKATYDPTTKTYHFERDNIRITNVRFMNNKIDIKIEEKE